MSADPLARMRAAREFFQAARAQPAEQVRAELAENSARMEEATKQVLANLPRMLAERTEGLMRRAEMGAAAVHAADAAAITTDLSTDAARVSAIRADLTEIQRLIFLQEAKLQERDQRSGKAAEELRRAPSRPHRSQLEKEVLQAAHIIEEQIREQPFARRRSPHSNPAMELSPHGRGH